MFQRCRIYLTRSPDTISQSERVVVQEYLDKVCRLEVKENYVPCLLHLETYSVMKCNQLLTLAIITDNYLPT